MEISDATLKTCRKCLLNLPILDFYLYKKKDRKLSYRNSYCKKCSKNIFLQSVIENPEKEKIRKKNWYIKYKDKINKRRKEWAIRIGYKQKRAPVEVQRARSALKTKMLRKQLLEGFGHICACCGETKKEFLALDHINGGGSAHRKLKKSHAIYREVIKLGFPKDRFRLLCHNCNQSIGYYGYCPHGNLNVDSISDLK